MQCNAMQRGGAYDGWAHGTAMPPYFYFCSYYILPPPQKECNSHFLMNQLIPNLIKHIQKDIIIFGMCNKYRYINHKR